MGDLISSISFQENNITWMEVEVDAGHINIKKVAEHPLPFVINYENLQKAATTLEIANQLKAVKEENGFRAENMRFLLSAKFSLIKKVYVDQYIPQEVHSEVVKHELARTLSSPTNNYLIYTPEYERENNFLQEILTVVLPKDLYAFFQEIGDEAQLSVEQINLNCFTFDELYRRFFPNLIGETMLVNFIESGYEIIVSDQKNFLNYFFKPYSKTFQSIDQLDENEIVSNFASLVEEIQRPGSVDLPLYSVAQIYVFGKFFKSNWLGLLQEQGLPTTHILNPTDSSEWQITFDDQQINTDETFRLVEPMSNIF